MKAFNIKKIDDVISFFEWLLTKVDTFHCDDDFRSFINKDTNEPTFTSHEGNYLNNVMGQCFKVCEQVGEDIYLIGHDVMIGDTKNCNDAISYRTNQLLLVTDTDQYRRSIILKSSGGANTTKHVSISDAEFMAISEVLIYEHPKYPNFEKMSTYQIFMTLQGWDIEALRHWLKVNDRNGEYNDSDEWTLTKDYAISTIIEQTISNR